ncbi:MAG: GNAT family N-acetyltransferase, partial [Myxococcota bacterium]
EWDELFDLLNRCFRPQGGRMQDCFPHFLCTANRKNLWVFAQQGRIHAHIGMLHCMWHLHTTTLHVGRIGAVCVAPELRNQGIGQQLFAHAKQQARQQSLDLLVISGQSGIYTRQGAEQCGKISTFTFEVQRLPSSTFNGIRPFRKADLPRWKALYSAKPVRFSRDNWDILLGDQIVPWARNVTQCAWNILQHERIVATLVTWQRAEYFEVVEWSGDDSVLFPALRAVGETLQQSRCVFSLPWHEAALYNQCLKFDPAPQISYGEGTVCLLRPLQTPREQTRHTPDTTRQAAVLFGGPSTLQWSPSVLLPRPIYGLSYI